MNTYTEASKANFLALYELVGLTFAKSWANSLGVSAAQIQLWVLSFTKGGI